MSEKNPFFAGEYSGMQTYHVDAASRLDAAKRFNLEECRAALQVKGLQKTVATALERRIRKLEREPNHG
ncbi:MAG: hypothetical protein JJU06_06000 [Ectothiorhodospiraceae bacterium]|nr:hypothetical protein [Ectothiorhodospiraceae bacterium]